MVIANFGMYADMIKELYKEQPSIFPIPEVDNLESQIKTDLRNLKTKIENHQLQNTNNDKISYSEAENYIIEFVDSEIQDQETFFDIVMVKIVFKNCFEDLHNIENYEDRQGLIENIIYNIKRLLKDFNTKMEMIENLYNEYDEKIKPKPVLSMGSTVEQKIDRIRKKLVDHQAQFQAFREKLETLKEQKDISLPQQKSEENKILWTKSQAELVYFIRKLTEGDSPIIDRGKTGKREKGLYPFIADNFKVEGSKPLTADRLEKSWSQRKLDGKQKAYFHNLFEPDN